MGQDNKYLPDSRVTQKWKNLTPAAKFRIGIGVLLLFFILPFFSRGCFSRPQKMTIPPRPVKTAVVVKKDVPVYIDSFGTLSSPNNVDLKAQVTGQIKEIRFQEGDEIAKGDVLFVINPVQYSAEFDKTRAVLAEDLVDLKLQQDTLKRNSQLIDKNLISQQDFEKYQTNVASAEAKVELDRAGMEFAQINLDYCYIKSPIDGVTGKRQVDPGNIVSANTGPTLVNIKTIEILYADFTVPDRKLPAVRRAMQTGKLKVNIAVEGDYSSSFTGQLDFLDNTVNNTTGTVFLRASVQNDERRLWPGQFIQVRLILGTEKNALLVPYAAVQLGQKGSYLFVVTPGNKADLRIVETGSRQGEYIVVKKGVKEGEKVVTVGQMGLAPGVPVVDMMAKEKEARPSGGSAK